VVQKEPKGRYFMFLRQSGMVLLLMAGVAVSSAAVTPLRFNYQGKLADAAGNPLSGNHTLFFSLWQGGSAGASNTGTKVFEEQAVVNIINGVASHPVGGGTSQLPGALTQNMLRTAGIVYLQVAIDAAANVVLPRARIESVPYALLSADGDARIPLSQPAVFPLTISQPGSYYLTGNIKGVSGKHGIDITTNGVVLDLSGYQVEGVPGSLTGIRASIRFYTAIRNGTILNWGQNGVSVSTYSHCSDLRVAGCNAEGILVGATSIIERCIAESNGFEGLQAGPGSYILDCTSSGNSSSGILASESIVRGCVTRSNSDHGITTTFGSNISNCISENNSGDGIFAPFPPTFIANCTIHDNQGDGIEVGGSSIVTGNLISLQETGCGINVVGTDNRIESNNVLTSLTGIKVIATGNFITRNTCSGNDTNWNVAAGNKILVINATSSAGIINGDSGGTAIGTNDPNANFTY
jgi:hypothetical protein